MSEQNDGISRLREAIGECMLADQRAFRRQLRQIARDRRSNRDAQLDRLAKRIEASIERRRVRDGQRPTPTYPPELPITLFKDEIAQAIASNQVTVICGETGSGKTTQLPKICMELGRGVAGMIGHTQPRRIAARSVAARIAQELNVALGQAVGYKVRFNDKLSHNTCLKVMTDGILLSETQRDRDLLQYDTIIIDEAHERSLNIDFLLGYLKQLLPRRPDLKVIVTSATIDPQRFSRHFNDAPVLEVPGRVFPIEVRYRPVHGEEADEEDPTVLDAILRAVDECVEAGEGDILVFLSGEREIREAVEALRRRAKMDANRAFAVLPLYARLSLEEQNRVFEPGDRRRIVLATNVAETSLTVPNIRFVIDPGLARINRYSATARVQRLPVEAISQASANQRKGRCGRLGPGLCIRLYSEDDFNDRPPFTDPEILRSNLAGVILQMKALRLGDLAEFPFVEPPRSAMVREGYQTLLELGAVDERGELTPTGAELAKLPVDPRIGRMILAARAEGSLREVLIIASALATQDPRLRPLEQAGPADVAHAQFADDRSDFLSYLKLWEFYHRKAAELSSNKLRKLCRDSYLSYVRLREWVDVHGQLSELAREAGLTQNDTPASYEGVHRALLAGLLGHVAVRGQAHEYTGVRERKLSIFPGSALFRKGPRWIMAAEVVETTRLFARTAARIKPEWIERLAQHLVKRSYSAPHWNRQTSHVEAFERVTLHGLTIVPKRRVHFGKIDPALARELFIQHALVDGEYTAPPDHAAEFLRRNSELIEQVRSLEAKSRKRDVLVEPEDLFAFYDRRIPEHITNGPAFEAWRRQAERDDPSVLMMSRADLMRHDARVVTGELFPDELLVEGMRLPLEYKLDPGAADDGVTLILPIEALRQIRGDRMEWLVPGLLEEKMVALLRSLPKELRRQLVPAPAFAAMCAQQAVFGAGSLLDAMSEALLKHAGMAIPRAAWRPQSLPDHLRMNYKVLGGDGRVLASGRDLDRIRRELAASTADTASPFAESPLNRHGITTWDFGDLPERIEIERNGITVLGYPALVDEGESVALRVLDSPQAAARLGRAGLRRLFVLAVRDEISAHLDYAPGIDRMEQQFATLIEVERRMSEDAHDGAARWRGGLHPRVSAAPSNASPPAPPLRSQLAELVADRAFLGEKPDLRRESEFDQRLNEGWERLWASASSACELAGRILDAAESVRHQLERATHPALLESAEEIRRQAARLVPPDFLVATPPRWLEHLPRFLQATSMRLRKLADGGLRRDIENREIVANFARRLEDRLAQLGNAAIDRQELQEFRWMIEELRVSLFAQELGTSVPISPRRLEKMWAQLEADRG